MSVALIACGKVGTSEKAAVDAPDPDALTCPAEQLACSGACADPMTDPDHCGACDGTCTTAEDCVAGHCTDTTASCFEIKQLNPAATDGTYTHRADGSVFFCDMTDMMEYDELDMLEFDIAHTGYTLATPADLQTPILQAAFIALYNAQHGLKVTTPWTSVNCCFKADTALTTNMFFLSGSNVQPSAASATLCNPAGGYLTTTTYQLEIQVGAVFGTDPLADDFFTTHPATAVAAVAPVRRRR